MNQKERLHFLITKLIAENKHYKDLTIPEHEQGQKNLLRTLMNVRMPEPIDEEFLEVQDAYLSEEIAAKRITSVQNLTPIKDYFYLWQGDITTLSCDAIVNAANSGLTGCYVPNHKCIDNAIHTFAGIQLRLKCAEIMKKQGYAEPTGIAKITKAYNLPCRYILHTVGPIVNGNLTEEHCNLLKNSYLSCLELASDYNLESVAFCCISTGEFHFPNELAAKIAIDTISNYMKNTTSIKKVIINVFKDVDREIYRKLLQ